MNNIETTTVKGLKVNQFTEKPIVIASIGFPVLKRMVRFTYREPQNYDPFDPKTESIKVKSDINLDYYQRLSNDKRIKEIYTYLLKEINNIVNEKQSAIGTFPTSIIISLDLNQEFDSCENFLSGINDYDIDDPIGAFLTHIDNTNVELTIPFKKVSLIVDGQHRIAGMMKLYNDAKIDSVKIGWKSLNEEYPLLTANQIVDAIENFDFNCAILVGFDKWEQGKVFADVNFNQKPVNKSLYYDIFGSYPDPIKNDIFLAHMLAMHLNNNTDSVVRDFIKMLGTGKGHFSQAFFVEAILSHFKQDGIWGNIPMDYLNNGSQFRMLPKFFKAYFKVVSEIFNDYWPKPEEDTNRKYKHILCKTTGMGALIKLIDPIYRDLRKDINIMEVSQKDLEKMLFSILVKVKKMGSDLFSSSGRYIGSGSLGAQNNLFRELKDELGYSEKK